jgi:hypothetical protein
MRRGHLLSLVLAGLPACADSSTEFWQPKSVLLPMVALDDRIAYVDKTSTATLLDPGSSSLSPDLVAVGKNPLNAAKHTGSNRLLVVSGGDRGSATEDPVKPQMAVVDPASTEDPGLVPLDSRFDGLAQSAEGHYAALYHTTSNQDANDGALFNPNDLVILDFSDNPKGMPKITPRSIRSMGGVPSSPTGAPIKFSPVYNFQAGPRRLAVVLSLNYVTIFDLQNSDRTEISVPLCPSSITCNYSVNQVVFDPGNFNIYIRAEGAKDIFQVALTDLELAKPTAGGNDFRASLSMLAVGSSATDMSLYGSGKDARLAVAAPDSKSLVIIDPSTSRSVTVALGVPASTIVPFTAPGPDPSNPSLRNQALLVDTRSGSASVVFADLESVETSGGLSLSPFSIRGSADRVLSLADQGMAILLYRQSYGGAALSVVNLLNRSFFDFNSAAGLGTTWNIELRSTGPSRLWSVDSPDTGTPSSSGIHYMDLAASNSQTHPTVWLDQAIVSITALAKPSSDNRRYLVLESSDPNTYGNLTFLDADNPERATARSARGFLFADYLGRTAP